MQKKFVHSHTLLKFKCPSLNALSLSFQVKEMLLSKSAKLSNYIKKLFLASASAKLETKWSVQSSVTVAKCYCKMNYLRQHISFPTFLPQPLFQCPAPRRQRKLLRPIPWNGTSKALVCLAAVSASLLFNPVPFKSGRLQNLLKNWRENSWKPPVPLYCMDFVIEKFSFQRESPKLLSTNHHPKTSPVISMAFQSYYFMEILAFASELCNSISVFGANPKPGWFTGLNFQVLSVNLTGFKKLHIQWCCCK